MSQIKLSPFSRPAEYGNFVEAVHPWPESTFLQGGFKGLVVSREPNTPSYTTVFVEAFVDNTFIRGEGTSLEEAETSAWNKFLQYRACPGHEWESRGYQNGAGFCKHCNKFASGVFSGEELGQFCATCGKGTFYGQVPSLHRDTDPEYVEHWYCELHTRAASAAYLEYIEQFDVEDLSGRERSNRSLTVFLTKPEEDEVDLSSDEFEEALKDVLEGLSKPDGDN